MSASNLGLTDEEEYELFLQLGERIRLKNLERTALHNYQWPDLVDVFKDEACPRFPIETLPPAMADYAKAQSELSGFDVGAYGFSLLCYAAALIDHRHKIDVGPFKAPAFIWGGLVDQSGGGKSPVFKAARRFVDEHNKRLCEDTQRRILNWQEECQVIGMRKKDEHPPRPELKQFIGADTTTESLADLLQASPSGILLGAEEITELIGRMDAYTNGSGGKDRGVYLRAFDGGYHTINRATRGLTYFSNFSFAIVAGMQPKKLAELFRKSGGSSDGLYQRFLMYQMQTPGKAVYQGRVSGHYIDSCREIFEFIARSQWDEATKDFILCDEAREQMQDYHNHCRIIATTSGGNAFSEHTNKYPGFLARLTLALHFITGASERHLPHEISLDRYIRAETIAKCLYAHSKALYVLFDGGMDRQQKMARSAAETILHHRWTECRRGDLTRYAADWRGVSEFEAQAAIDLLIMYGWIEDATPPSQPGKKGRPSKGYYVVNPAVHLEFMDHAEKIAKEKSEKIQAMKRCGYLKG